MSSGEVLFVLVFIVLPTAVLVSAVWAAVFVYQSPARIAQRRQMLADMEQDKPEPILFGSEELLLDPAPEMEPEPTPEPEPDPAPEPQTEVPEPAYDSEIPQTTEDLSSFTSAKDGVGAVEQEQREPEPPADTEFETGDLPKLGDVESDDPSATARSSGEQVERRRRQQARLLPGDADAGRRRNRPLLGRSPGRKGDSQSASEPVPDQH